MTRLKCLGLGLVAGLTACTWGTEYQPKTLGLANHWQATRGQLLAVEAVEPAPLAAWWHALGDPALDRLMREALAGNLDLAVATTRIDQARAYVRGNRAEQFPQIGAEAGGQRQSNPFPGFAPGISYNLFQLGFDAVWELDLFGRQQRRYEAAAADLDAAREAYAEARLTLSADIARAYTGFLSQRAQWILTEESLAAEREAVRMTERLYEEGVAPRQDVIQAKTLCEVVEAQLPVLEAEQTAQLRQLELLSGKSPGTLLMAESAANPIAEWDDRLPGKAILDSPVTRIRLRPDVRAAERRFAAASALKGAALAEWFPKVSLSAFLGLRNTDLDTVFQSAAFSYGTAASLLQPLFNAGRIQAGIDLADARQREASLIYEQTVLESVQETETAITRFLAAVRHQYTLKQATNDRRETLHIMERQAEEGLISQLELMDGRRSLHQTEMDWLKSRVITRIHLISIYKTLGGGTMPESAATAETS
ncbi:MAG: efflux transporter outer membrane subunit [Methylococcaceae bacterium]